MQVTSRTTPCPALDSNPSPEKRQKNLDKAVQKLLKDFRPKAGK